MDHSGTATSDPIDHHLSNRYRLRLLGGWQLTEDDRPMVLPLSAQRLIALTAVTGPRPRCFIGGTLWPEQTERRASGSLRSVLWRLRDCGRDLLDVRDGTIALRVGVRVDVKDLVRTVRDAVDRAPVGRIGIRELVDVGELLPGWYDEWVLGERERLGQLRLHALESLALQVMAEGRYATAMELALAAVRTEPHRDSANRAVIRIHLAEGNLMDAVQYYRRFRQQQLQGLGVEPSEETRSLVRPLIGATAPEAAATTSPGGTGRPATPSARAVAAGATSPRATASARVVSARVASRTVSEPESWR